MTFSAFLKVDIFGFRTMLKFDCNILIPEFNLTVPMGGGPR